jgi:uncharacterized membrane protein YfcA
MALRFRQRHFDIHRCLNAAVGGWLGAEYGSNKIGSKPLQRLLAVVLTITGIKLIWI